MQKKQLKFTKKLWDKMKKILLVSFYFPPFLNMRSIRASKIAKYLEREGWEVFVLTADRLNLDRALPVEADEKRIIRVSFDDKNVSLFPLKLKKSKILRRFFNYQDRFLKWCFRALNVGRKILNREKISLILSFSPPYPSHILASKLSKEFNLPWIGEFGDLWSENYYLKRIFPLSILEKFLEKVFIKRASSLISVSKNISKRLEKIHKKEIFLFPHLFDDEDYKINVPPQENFTLSYTGHLYPYQNFKTFLNALRLIKEEGSIEDIKIKFFSYNHFEIKEWFKEFSDLPIEINPQIPYLESIKAQISSSALLFFSIGKDVKDRENPIKGKLFSYIGARKPVLVVGEDDGGIFLEKIGVGKICRNEEEVKKTIEKWYIEFKEKGNVGIGNLFDWENYSYKNRISELSNFLEKFLER